MSRCGVTVRNAEPEDLDQVFLIELESFKEPYPRWYFDVLYIISNNGEFFLVSLDNRNRVDGYLVAVKRKSNVCHIVSIAVRKDCRRQRVGSALLQSLFEICESHNPNLYVLEVEIWNMSAQMLYTRHGFNYIGLIPGYYGDKRHALIMAKYLPGMLVEKRLY